MNGIGQKDAWRAFITYAIPARMASRAALAVGNSHPRGDQSAHSSAAAALRRLRNGGVACPNPSTVWDTGFAIRTLPQRDWCAGPLLLFAAGHFDWYARLLSDVSEVYVPASRKAALLASTLGAVEYREPAIDEAIAAIRASNISDTLSQRKIERVLRHGVSPITAERTVWSLSVDEEESFTDTYLRVNKSTSADAFANHPKPGVVSAWLVSRHPEIGLQMQRSIVLSNLWREMSP